MRTPDKFKEELLSSLIQPNFVEKFMDDYNHETIRDRVDISICDKIILAEESCNVRRDRVIQEWLSNKNNIIDMIKSIKHTYRIVIHNDLHGYYHIDKEITLSKTRLDLLTNIMKSIHCEYIEGLIPHIIDSDARQTVTTTEGVLFDKMYIE